jgi:hypothetical protein
MRESSLNHTVRAALKRVAPYVFAQRIESMCGPGVPDLYLRMPSHPAASAWVENKHMAEFPKRPGTKVRIPHLSAEQLLWLRQHGSGAWLFVQVGKEYFLWSWVQAQTCQELTAAEWRDQAVLYGRRPFDWQSWVDTIFNRG